MSVLEAWGERYNLINGRITLTGWSFGSKAECETYFASRVKAKIHQSDCALLLQEYLLEMADTGFDTSALHAQVERPPLAKDWEVGEAFAEVMLEDSFDASFPWPTSWDKRTPKASLPGPDIAGFHRRACPRFLFGEVKSSSEAKCPPQVANSGGDCLHKQVKRLLTSERHRHQLIGWLLVRAQDSPRWRPVFDDAVKRYAVGEACICGVLVRGGLEPAINDLASVQDELTTSAGTFDVMLLAFYLPLDKSKWVGLVYGTESIN